MSFRPQDLHDFDVAREVRIETHSDGDNVNSTVIWVVVDRDQMFVRSIRGAQGRWYQEAVANPDVNIDDRGRRLEARAVPVHDEDSNQRVTEALKRKYAYDAEGLATIVTPESLEGTLRLEPRSADEIPLQAPAYLGADQPSELGPAVEVSMLDAGPAIEENVLLQPHKSV